MLSTSRASSAGALFSLIALFAAGAAAMQITTGSVAGTVKDSQGGVIPGAQVTLVNEAQGTRAVPVVTDVAGDFLFVNVPAGSYALEVTMPAFKTLKQTGIDVTPGSRTIVGTLTLEVGGKSETVNVRADLSALQGTTGERSFTIDTEEVANL